MKKLREPCGTPNRAKHPNNSVRDLMSINNMLGPENFVTPLGLVAGAMLIFLNDEGFERIANASMDIDDPKRCLLLAYIDGNLIAIVIYVLIVVMVVGHLGFKEISKVSDNVLSVAAQDSMGRIGYIGIAIAALMATSSAINATFYSTGRLAYIIARTGELPKSLERTMRGQHLEGTLMTASLPFLLQTSYLWKPSRPWAVPVSC